MKEYAALKEKGYGILRNKISQDWVNDLKSGAYKAFEEHRQIQIRNGNDIQTEGVALHVLLSDPIFIMLLHCLNLQFTAKLNFIFQCILNFCEMISVKSFLKLLITNNFTC